ncbi:MAG: TetR family transcriptional regulator [Alphaproteobacteria bacterium]
MAVRKKAADTTDRIVDAALDLAAKGGWRGVSLEAIADAAKLDPLVVYRATPTRVAVLEALMRRIDAAVLAGAAADGDAGSVHDRLLDLLLRRLEALAPHRAAIAAIVRDLPADPLEAVAVLPQAGRSLARMVAAAGLGTAGPAGALRVKLLGLVWAQTVRSWLGADDPDLSRAMATLDRALGRAERLGGPLSLFASRGDASPI